MRIARARGPYTGKQFLKYGYSVVFSELEYAVV
jgi:hypothetical protein